MNFCYFYKQKSKIFDCISGSRRTIPGGKTRGHILPVDTSIPPGIDISLFHVEI